MKAVDIALALIQTLILMTALAATPAGALTAAPGTVSGARSPSTADWPTLPLPRDLGATPIAVDFWVDGLATRTSVFLSTYPADELAKRLRSAAAADVVDSRIGRKLVLGIARGGFYTTIVLEPVHGQTRGVVSTVRLVDERGRPVRRVEVPASLQRWLGKLPSGMRVLRSIRSTDRAETSTQVVLAGSAQGNAVADALRRALAADGFQPRAIAIAQGDEAGSRVLAFAGASGEVTAVIGLLRDGRTSVVLTLVEHLGAGR